MNDTRSLPNNLSECHHLLVAAYQQAVQLEQRAAAAEQRVAQSEQQVVELYRQEDIFVRHGLHIGRSTQCD